jgi:protein gp37
MADHGVNEEQVAELKRTAQGALLAPVAEEIVEARGVVHFVGPDVQIDNMLRQRCSWCGDLLIDYDLSRTASPCGEACQAGCDPAHHRPATWPDGTLVEVDGGASWAVDHDAVDPARVWAVMATTPQHTYQILTKRHGRMRSLLNSERFKIWTWAAQGDGKPGCTPLNDVWPLPNVWLGVSVEDQKRADLRIPALLDTPAAVRWLSCEPLLGPVDLFGRWGLGCEEVGPAVTHEGVRQRTDYGTGVEYDCDHQVGIDWVVVGGESGPGARPMHPAWARSLRDQCTAAGVPFHFKQWGAWRPLTGFTQYLGAPIREHRRLDDEVVVRVGKKSAGRELDGRTWDEFPSVSAGSGAGVPARPGGTTGGAG